MTNKIKQIDGYWVIGTNKWRVDNYTKEQAEMHSRTLINCENCIDCRNCIGCSSCSSCAYCSDCHDCHYFSNCRNCIDCTDCRNCIGCSSCNSCAYCSDCTDCRDCSGCRICIDCTNCRDCHRCIDCIDCINCRDCLGFKTNPERITSPKLGSRDSQTTFYWNNEKEQIVCGCYKGTLEEFKEKIKETHGDNEFAQGYFKWIESIKFYKLTYAGKK